jgi:hypothetical protein
MKLETIKNILNFIRLKENKEIPQKWYEAFPKQKFIISIKDHPDNVVYKHENDLDLSYSNVKKLPNKLHVIGDLSLSGCEELEVLPDDLYVRGVLDLFGTSIKKLPDDLYVGSDLFVDDTELTEIPRNLYVGGDFAFGYTQLAKENTDEEIRQIVASTGGIIKGKLIRTFDY